jgi:ferric-dicitrate binding protein FerR (iron transport regulator)
MIEEMYGYRMESKDDPSLMQRAVSGDLRAANLEEFLSVLEVTFKLKMTKENKTILVTKP